MAFIPIYIFILFVLIIIDYIAGIKIQQSKGKLRKAYLLLSIFSTIAFLFIFKYFNFFNANFEVIAHFLHLNYPLPVLELILPIGLSFHTFQSLSYVIEVYKRKQKAERHFGIYALYVMFYPQLVSGPIERPQHLLPQLHKHHIFSNADTTEGLKRMIFGFFKKIVIADRLSLVVNQVYASPQDYTGIPLIIATVAFAFQIYCDFSGYSDIAIGSARVMGITLVENFNYPYVASSIPEFWRRWHMSLYSWFRDYIYIPLGGNRGNSIFHFRNILIVFTISGLWHGAQWTYVLWGFLHGLYMVISTILKGYLVTFKNLFKTKNLQSFWRMLCVAATFFLVCVAWVFFRASTITDAWYILTHGFIDLEKVSLAIFINDTLTLDKLIFGQGKGLGLLPEELLIAVVSIGAMGIYEWMHVTKKITMIPQVIRYAIYILLILAILNLGITKKIPFVYFQF
ncbi:MAG: MBOAT family O-acyltransferase [Patescibacteria group bacterium]